MLQIEKWVLGPVATNTYLVGDPDTNQAVVIDPAWDGKFLAEEIKKGGWQKRMLSSGLSEIRQKEKMDCQSDLLTSMEKVFLLQGK